MDSIFFLEGDKPIVKTYTKSQDGSIQKQSYPFVYNVTSYEEKPASLEALLPIIQKHASKGHCMLKGELSRTLTNESRQGSTKPDTKTDWICLDLDGIANFESIDLFLDEIKCGDTDYIIQWSSSMNIENNSGYRCHIFMLLDKPQHPQLLKYWLMGLNLDVPLLNCQLELTKTALSLRWPLDITTCQNDKLLYIAPPQLNGIIDPFISTPRIAFFKRKNRAVTLPYPIPNKNALRQKIDQRVDDLRVAVGLPKKRKSKFAFSGTTEYLSNPESSTITDIKTERGFVYFNLNGGNSWGYFHPEDNPNFIYNFKGEPTYRTQDLLPEYWATLQQSSGKAATNSKGETFRVFREFRTGNYYNCIYHEKEGRLNLAQAKSESQIRQFAKTHGLVLGECIPDWDLVWNPHSTVVIDDELQQLNTFQPSKFMRIETIRAGGYVPPTIMKIICNVLNDEDIAIEHFLNWLAVIMQYRCSTATAWVFQGTQGTGKGILFHRVITPLLGEHNVVARRMEELESQFTDFMENKFAIFIDEIEAGDGLYHNKITAKLKNLIVEPRISIRRMYTHSYEVENFSNMIFASNKDEPVTLDPSDRRFNVGGYQEKRLSISEHEVTTLIPGEIEDFYHYLMSRTANRQIARTDLKNEAKMQLIDISQKAREKVSYAIKTGDLEFFWAEMPAKEPTANAFEFLKYQQYRDLLVQITKDVAKGNTETKLTREDLMVLYNFCVEGMPKSAGKFTAVLKHHRIFLSQIWAGKNARGIVVSWKTDPEWLKYTMDEIDAFKKGS